MNRPVWKWIAVLAPIVVVLAFAALYRIPSTRGIVLSVLDENQPVEVLTFVALLAGGLLGLDLVRRLSTLGTAKPVLMFYTLFSIALVVVAMEEIAWGQWLFGFDTPEALKELNAQNEVTLHNLEAMQQHNDLLTLLFGIGGLVGVALGMWPAFRTVAPSSMLLTWFLVISVAAGIEALLDSRILLDDYYGLFEYHLPEVIEMLVGLASLLYVMLNRHRLLTDPAGSSTCLPQSDV